MSTWCYKKTCTEDPPGKNNKSASKICTTVTLFYKSESAVCMNTLSMVRDDGQIYGMEINWCYVGQHKSL